VWGWGRGGLWRGGGKYKGPLNVKKGLFLSMVPPKKKKRFSAKLPEQRKIQKDPEKKKGID